MIAHKIASFCTDSPTGCSQRDLRTSIDHVASEQTYRRRGHAAMGASCLSHFTQTPNGGGNQTKYTKGAQKRMGNTASTFLARQRGASRIGGSMDTSM